MSDSLSYRLEAPRPRPPPPPLRFQSSPFTSSSALTTNQNTQTLLYDLPSTTSMSPPPSSSRSKGRLTSPTSPSGRSKGLRGGRSTPPPSRNRSTTPLSVAPSELEKFAEHCRAWYYNQDDASGRLMTQTLTHLPPSQRAPFARLQASIRSGYHANINARRTAEFQAHLGATQPGGSLMPHSRSNPSGPVAAKERYDRLDRFVRTWCTIGMPGTRPFFEALWAVMRLQVVPENIGGAGGNRIDWEFDDAVFKEAAGKDFMLEAIDVLKGVLAFEEARSSSSSSVSNNFDTYISAPPPHSRTQSQPLPSLDNKPFGITTTVQQKRARAPSDPFLDTPALSRSVASTTSQSSGNTVALLSSLASQGADEPPSPVTPPPDNDSPLTCGHRGFIDDSEEDYLRIWTSPDLPNPEYLSLLNVFPSFIARRPLPRFPVTPGNRRPADIEEGDEEGAEAKQIRFGTGMMWVSSKERSEGWEGGWWTRFINWWRKVFC